MMYFNDYCKRVKLVCFAILALSSSLAGEGVELEFISFPKDAQPADLELLIGENQTQKIEVPTNRISKPYKVPRLGKWIIGMSGDDGGVFIFNRLGEASSLDSKRQLILILCRRANESEEIQLIPIDISASGLCGGRHLLVNHTIGTVSGELGSQEFSLEVGEHVVLNPLVSQTNANAQTHSAAVSMYYDGKGRPFFSSNWRVSPKARNIVIVYHDSKTQQLRLHSIRDHIKQ